MIRRDATGTTLYLPGQEVRREGGVNTGTRYYSFAGTICASRKGASSSTDLTWLYPDHQGTQQTAINAGTQAVSVRRQTPYGDARGENPVWVNGKGFVGGDIDPTGLVNIGARQYDKVLGRFISVDPALDLTDPRQWNAYAYSHNSPVTHSDPTGLRPECGGGTYNCSNDFRRPTPRSTRATGPTASERTRPPLTSTPRNYAPRRLRNERSASVRPASGVVTPGRSAWLPALLPVSSSARPAQQEASVSAPSVAQPSAASSAVP
ncbi:RHS repeat-associated core domain-containing protein [Plantactinospora sp. BC1]|uniref:RHS repeat-associated core domain-containing protein n=1 Tax=Plantactinospora sp. BC1 TaxID=2108470 RepID=UPI0035144728